jgi:hypothetical protein
VDGTFGGKAIVSLPRNSPHSTRHLEAPPGSVSCSDLKRGPPEQAADALSKLSLGNQRSTAVVKRRQKLSAPFEGATALSQVMHHLVWCLNVWQAAWTLARCSSPPGPPGRGWVRE